MPFFPKSIFGNLDLDIYFCPKQKSQKDFWKKYACFDFRPSCSKSIFLFKKTLTDRFKMRFGKDLGIFSVAK